MSTTEEYKEDNDNNNEELLDRISSIFIMYIRVQFNKTHEKDAKILINQNIEDLAQLVNTDVETIKKLIDTIDVKIIQKVIDTGAIENIPITYEGSYQTVKREIAADLVTKVVSPSEKIAILGGGRFFIEEILKISDNITYYYFSKEEHYILENMYPRINFKEGNHKTMDKLNKIFDEVVGNPPYNKPKENSDNSSRSSQIYDDFVDISYNISKNNVALVIPTRWSISKSMTKFRNKMINEYGISYLKLLNKDVFKDVGVDGGICYFIGNKNNTNKEFILEGIDGNKYNYSYKDHNLDILILEDYFETALKVFDIFANMEKMDKKYKNPQAIKSNDVRLQKTKLEKNDIKVKASKDKDFYINKNKINVDKYDIDKYKVMFERVNGGYKENGFNGLRILAPGTINTQSISYFPFDTEKEAINCMNFLKTKFVFFLRNLSQADKNFTSPIFRYIPFLDFNENWDDNKIANEFNIVNEFELINRIVNDRNTKQ